MLFTRRSGRLFALIFVFFIQITVARGFADDVKGKGLEEVQQKIESIKKDTGDALSRGDMAWMLCSSALVMFMVPGLALFYGGMVRRKNVLATMMQSFTALAIVGVFWVVCGYGLAFGPSQITVAGGGIIGWDSNLFCLKGILADQKLPGTNITVFTHVMFQGMFAIITPALISGAIAERIRFWPFCIFMILWTAFVYCPLAHMVWAFDWFYVDPLDEVKGLGGSPIGFLGQLGALDFAGGTVVHIAAGLAGLAGVIVLRKRHGYPGHAMHPNSMVLTLLGAGLLWFGWFGFNGGSAGNATGLAASAFAATQAAAAVAGITWVFVEWLHRGKPTALGMASGIVAGLVAVTPASGFVPPWAGVLIGIFAAVGCYASVYVKSILKYDDSLDAFGVHGIGGIIGALLTGLFCYVSINSAGADGYFAIKKYESQLSDAQGLSEKSVKSFLERLEKIDKEKLDESLGNSDKFKSANAMEKQLSEATSDYFKSQKKLIDFEKGLAKNKPSKAQEETLTALKNQMNRRLDKVVQFKEDGKQIAEKWLKLQEEKKGPMTQLIIQGKAVLVALVFSFIGSLLLFGIVHLITGRNFSTSIDHEVIGLDQTEHGETGFDFGMAFEEVPTKKNIEPRAAKLPPGSARFEVVVEGVQNGDLMHAWNTLCQPPSEGKPLDPDFVKVYRHVTTVQGNRFRCKGGNSKDIAANIQKLFSVQLNRPGLSVHVEE